MQDDLPGAIPSITQIPVCCVGVCVQTLLTGGAFTFSVPPVIQHQDGRTSGSDFADLEAAVGEVPAIPVEV
jgi:hypothetical protein